MKFYYGLIDTENNGWGFLEEGDSRITSNMIEITEERWQELLNEQSEGREVVLYNGELFTTIPRRYIWQDGELVVNPNYEAEQAAKEEERINKLTMTALDFINVLKSAGFTDEQIESYLSSNLSVKHQLQFCQNVYCGVAKALMPITVGDITITADMVEIAFRLKNGEQIEEDNSTDEVSEEPPIEVEISSNPSVDNNEEIEE